MAIASVPVAVALPPTYGVAIALPANKTREETRTPLFIALFDFLPFDLVISETATQAPKAALLVVELDLSLAVASSETATNALAD